MSPCVVRSSIGPAPLTGRASPDTSRRPGSSQHLSQLCLRSNPRSRSGAPKYGLRLSCRKRLNTGIVVRPLTLQQIPTPPPSAESSLASAGGRFPRSTPPPTVQPAENARMQFPTSSATGPEKIWNAGTNWGTRRYLAVELLLNEAVTQPSAAQTRMGPPLTIPRILA